MEAEEPGYVIRDLRVRIGVSSIGVPRGAMVMLGQRNAADKQRIVRFGDRLAVSFDEGWIARNIQAAPVEGDSATE